MLNSVQQFLVQGGVNVLGERTVKKNRHSIGTDINADKTKYE